MLVIMGHVAAAAAAGPQFLERSDGALIPAVPAGVTKFMLTPRSALPKVADFSARVDSSLGSGSLPEDAVREIEEHIIQSTAAGTATVTACLQVPVQMSPLHCSRYLLQHVPTSVALVRFVNLFRIS